MPDMFFSALLIVKVMLPKKCVLSYSDTSRLESQGERIVALTS